LTKIISVKEVANKIIHGEKMFIVDARNAEEFANWRIEGKNVEVVNIPYFEILDGVEPFLDRLPKDKNTTIYSVCAKGGLVGVCGGTARTSRISKRLLD